MEEGRIMAQTEAGAPAHGASVALRGWPGLFLTLVVLLAAAYSFSPRPVPVFPATQIYPDKIMVNGVARQGNRFVAVGENGHILVADAADGPWHEAKVTPARGSALTQVAFIADNTLVAVGHDSWILRSTDKGESWKEVNFDAERSEALLGLGGPYDNKLFALGVFGQYLTSTDGGATWTREVTGEGGHLALGEHHLNAMTRAADGSLLIVGERGLMAQSADNGATWKKLPDIYNGSFYGVLTAKDNSLLAFGMRGNVFRSADNGKTWQKSATPVNLSMFGGTVAGNGDVLLVGASDGVFLSTDNGAHFALALQEDRRSLAAILPLDAGWLMAGERGVAVRQLKTGAKS
jgi:photosystem II stability/assembly factor-like uncharacterized protein